MAKKLTKKVAQDMLEILSTNIVVETHKTQGGTTWIVVSYIDTVLARIRDDYGKVLKEAKGLAMFGNELDQHYDFVRYLLEYALKNSRNTEYCGDTLFEQVSTATFGGQIIVVEK